MAINPNIPLSVRTPDISQGIGMLTRAVENKRQREAEQPLRDLQMQQAQMQIDELAESRAGRQAASDMLNLQSFANADDFNGMRQYLQNVRKRGLQDAQSSDSSINTIQTDRLLEALDQNPAEVKAMINRGVDVYTRRGLIKPTQGGKTLNGIKLKNSETGQEVLVFPRVDNDGVTLQVPELPSGYEIAEDPKEDKNFDNATKLRKEYLSESKDFIKTRDAHSRVLAAAADPSPAGDLALIFNYMKVLDPGSTVREGEFATAQSARAELQRAESQDGAYVPNFVKGIVERLTEGTRLLPDQRADFVDRSQRLFDEGAKNHGDLSSRYRDLATRNDLDPSDVVIEFRMPQPIELGSGQAESDEDLPEGTVIETPEGEFILRGNEWVPVGG